MVPTAMGLRPPPGFCKGVIGALAMNSPRAFGQQPEIHRLTTLVIEANDSSATTLVAPLIASRRCWALNPSLQQEVPLGNIC